MIHDKLKKALAATSSLLLLFFIFPIGGLALKEQLPSPIAVSWFSPAGVSDLEKKDKVLVIHTEVNGQKTKLYVSFPEEGGFRLRTDSFGFFEPSGEKAIQYADSDGLLSMKAGDMSVTFQNDGSRWILSGKSVSGATAFSLSSSQIFFGYNDGELKKVKVENGIENGDVLFGTGERFNAFNQVGNELLLWNQDTNYHNAYDNPDFDPDRSKGYKNIPLLHNTRGYTLFFNSMYGAVADIGKSDRSRYSLDFNGPTFDLYVWMGTPLENINGYTKLTGRPILPPKWAFQYWAGAQKAVWDNLKGGPVPLLTDMMKNYKRLGMPNIAAVYFESCHELSPAHSLLKKTGTRMLSWNYPFAYTKQQITDLMPGVAEEDLPLVKSTINPWLVSHRPIDYTHPNAKKYILNQWGKYLDWTLRGIMIDYGEFVGEEHQFYNGLSGDQMHNFYSYWYGKAYYEAFDEKLKGDFVNFQRSACAGSQQWAANFTGDQASTYAGLKEQVLGVLSLSSSGFSATGGDIGGHLGTPSPDLYMRWLQFSSFVPLMRAHGQPSLRDPWAYGEQAEATFQTHYWLRENLLDSIYSAAVRAHNTGAPMVQAMPVAFPGQTALADNDNQFLFCDDFLVSPVLTENAHYREVTLPAGSWYGLWKGDKVKGGQTIQADAPQDKSPVYIRQGTVAPVRVAAKSLRLTDPMQDVDTTNALLVTPPDDRRENIQWTDETTKRVYSSEPLQDGGFRIQAEQPDDARALLVYGTAAAAVKVDGVSLKPVGNAEETGFFIDGAMTIVRLPEGKWTTVEILGADFEEYAKGGTISDSIGSKESVNLIDGNALTNIMLSTRNDYCITLDLGEEKLLDQVVLKWSPLGYATSYKVQMSGDNVEWTDVSTIEAGSGGLDTLRVSGKTARYIRLTEAKKGKNKAMCLYGIEVYGHAPIDIPDNFSESTPKKAFAGLTVPQLIIVSSLLVLLLVGGTTSALLLRARKKKITIDSSPDNETGKD